MKQDWFYLVEASNDDSDASDDVVCKQQHRHFTADMV